MQKLVDQELAFRLKELREHAKISLAGLAAAIGVTKTTIWRYETEAHFPSATRRNCEGAVLRTAQFAHATRIAAAETKHLPAAANDSGGLKSPALSAASL